MAARHLAAAIHSVSLTVAQQVMIASDQNLL